MAKSDAIEIVGDGSDTIFVTGRADGTVCLTVIEGDTGRSCYVSLNSEAVEQLSEAMIATRDA